LACKLGKACQPAIPKSAESLFLQGRRLFFAIEHLPDPGLEFVLLIFVLDFVFAA